MRRASLIQGIVSAHDGYGAEYSHGVMHDEVEMVSLLLNSYFFFCTPDSLSLHRVLSFCYFGSRMAARGCAAGDIACHAGQRPASEQADVSGVRGLRDVTGLGAEQG